MKKIVLSGIKDYYWVDQVGSVYSDFSGSLRQRKVEEDKDGYFKVSLCKSSGGLKKFFVHRLVALFYIENVNNYPVVNHKNGDKQDNHCDNLEWVTVSMNIKHAYTYGLVNTSKGENHYTSNITNEEVTTIYNYFLDGFRNIDAMKKFGISRGTAERIRNKRIFKDILKEFPDCKPSLKVLNDSEVRTICQILEENPTIPVAKVLDVAGINGLTKDSVYKIRSRKSYSHISKTYNW